MNLINKIRDYFVGAYQEMKKVTWPTKEQTINYSLIVVGLSVGMAVFLGILDYIFSVGIEKII